MSKLDKFDAFCTELKELNSHVEELLRQLPSQNLNHSSTRGGLSYYQVPPGGKAAQRVGIGRDPELVDLLIFKKYVESLRDVTEQNMEAARALLERYTEPSPENVIAAMRPKDQRLPFERALAKYGRFLVPPRPVIQEFPSPSFEIGAQQRRQIDSHEEWGRTPFDRSSDRYGNRTKITSQGLDVRSRGELLIAEKLYDYGVPFHHEEIVRVGNLTLVPDFTFEDAKGEHFHLEFCGMMADRRYVERHIQKMRTYEDMGIYPWKDLLLLYSDGDDIDMRIVDNMIRYQIIPRL